jgi:carbonic anhydrase/acetyltransferase-like protein (isoleucine patch superfamily)
MNEASVRHTTDDKVVIMSGAHVLGAVTFEAGCGVWFNAVIRGDCGLIAVGENTNIQDNAVIHTAEGGEVRLGRNVSIGHSAILHGCTVGDNSLIGMGSIVMDGAVVGNHCLVAAGAVVPSGMVIPDGSLVMGSPAVVKRALTQADKDYIRANAEEYVQKRELYR